ncbi:hypothetical protein WMY93_024790 [Mugilogobius chulae]|uniref:Uncharacterized protein n=1 Tax=Mugilogobius chulae TaxID=88201 RepID=A0AAW0N5F1_9GOBI
MESHSNLFTGETRRKRRRLPQTDTDGVFCSDATEYCPPIKRTRLHHLHLSTRDISTVDRTMRERKRSMEEALDEGLRDSSKYCPPSKRTRVQIYTEDIQMDSEASESDSDQMETDDSSNNHTPDDYTQMEIDQDIAALDGFVPMETDENMSTGALLDPVPMETNLDCTQRKMWTKKASVYRNADAPETQMETDSEYMRTKLLIKKAKVARKANASATKMETDCGSTQKAPVSGTLRKQATSQSQLTQELKAERKRLTAQRLMMYFPTEVLKQISGAHGQ